MRKAAQYHVMAQPAQSIEEPRPDFSPGVPPLPEFQAAATPTLALAATFTAEPLEETLQFWMQELATPWSVRFAPYNQAFQELLDPSSLLSTNTHGLNVVLLRFEDLVPSANRNTAPSGAILQRNARDLLTALKSATRHGAVPWLVCICPPSKAALADLPLAELLKRLDDLWNVKLSNPDSSILLTLPQDLLNLYPAIDYDDPQANQLGHVPYTPAFYAALGTLIARKFYALERPAKKVVALDCDQTLWDGICGEDGPAGIRFDAPRLALQDFMRHQYDAGTLLCLCSKNHDADVAEVFRCRTEMRLQPGHFAGTRLNWQPKSENLRALAGELNLGLDSFILIDDNPLECAEVEANCPEVLAIPLPGDPAEWPQFLQHIWAFDRWKATREDHRRNAMYHENRQREQFRAAAPSLAEFLAGLDLQVHIGPVRTEQLARVSQLTQRTNQFNCAPKHYSETEIAELARQKKCHILGATVSDRFGDYGLTGVMIFNSINGLLAVDVFLLSCRALGKGVEHRMLAHLGQIARQLGARAVEIPFHPTPRNQPAWNFLNSIGAAFRQDRNGASAFQFPAEVAASISFDPSNAAMPEPVSPINKLPPPEPLGRGRESAASGNARYVWIARNARDPEQILKLVEARRAAQSTPAAAAYTPPETERQRQLCELWRQVLQIDRVGIRDNFFELGGTSQLVVRMLAKWERQSGRRLSVATLFKAPTIEQLAELLE